MHNRRQKHTPNDKYENFINTHLEVAAECIPTKQKAKPRVPWETLVAREKCADMKVASKCNRKNPTNTNALKLKKAQNELAKIYLKEQTEYCDGKFLKIPKTGLYFRMCEDGAGWHLIPCRISPRSEFFSQAYKNWHIMWGINLGLD